MKTTIKKISVIFAILLLISTGMYSASAKTTEQQKTHTITIYRHSPDGKITPITINLDEETDEAIIKACQELLEQDEEIQNYIQTLLKMEEDDDNETKKLCMVISRGRGFHFKLPILMPPMILSKIRKAKRLINTPFIEIWNIIIIKMVKSLIKPSFFVFCRYPRDNGAKTVIAPLRIGQNNTYNGPHQITSTGFVGYTGWIMPRSRTGRLYRQIYVGISLGTTVKML